MVGGRDRIGVCGFWKSVGNRRKRGGKESQRERVADWLCARGLGV